MFAIPTDLLNELLEHATTDLGTDDGGNRHLHYANHGQLPAAFRNGLDHATTAEVHEVWQAPEWRAMLLEAAGAGEVVLFANRAQYESAAQSARRGIFPTMAAERGR